MTKRRSSAVPFTYLEAKQECSFDGDILLCSLLGGYDDSVPFFNSGGGLRRPYSREKNAGPM